MNLMKTYQNQHVILIQLIPLGTPNEIKGLHENVALFSYVGQICPTHCPTDLENFLKTIMIAPKGALRERTIEYQRGAC